MSELEENIHQLKQEVTYLQQEVTYLRTQVKASTEECKQSQGIAAMLLQTARRYRDAHETMTQAVRTVPPGKPITDPGRDGTSLEVNARALRSAQAMLFAAIDVVEEKSERTPETGDTPPE